MFILYCEDVITQAKGVVVQTQLSDCCKRAVLLARRIAIKTGQARVSPMHLLQAVLELSACRASKLLRHAGENVDEMRGVLRAQHVIDPGAEPPAQVKLDAETLAALEIASLAAKRMGHPCVMTDHIFLALLQMRGASSEALAIDIVTPIEQLEEMIQRNSEEESAGLKQPPLQREIRQAAEQWSAQAREFLAIAHHQAEQYQNAFLDIDHLLLALLELRETEGLELPGVDWTLVDTAAVRERIIEKLESARTADHDSVRLTVRTSKVLELANQEAYLAKAQNVLLEHIFLGMLGFEKGLTGEALHTDLAIAREKLLENSRIEISTADGEINLPMIDLKRYRLNTDLLNTIEHAVAQRYRFVPLHRHGNTLTIAISEDPGRERDLTNDLRQILGVGVQLVLAEDDEIQRLIKFHYAS